MRIRTALLFAFAAIAVAWVADGFLAQSIALHAASDPLATVPVLSAGMGLELVVGFVTAPSTTFTAWTMASGSSLTIRNAKEGSKVKLLQAWADNQGAGNLRIRSPRLHDNVQGIRAVVTVSDVRPLYPFGEAQPLIPQDTLIAEQTGSATAGDIETGAFLAWYEDLPGIEARLATWEQIKDRIRNIFTSENTLALGTAGGFSGEEAFNAEFDLTKANQDYALLGYLCSAECAAVRWRGADTGNLGVGGPGYDGPGYLTEDWFKRLSETYGIPTIPVFNAANKAGILVDGAQDENGADVTVTAILAELGPAA